MSVLVVAPHFDDAEFGCGGYLAKLKGVKRVRVLVLSASSYQTPSGQWVPASSRETEGQKSAKILGYDLVLRRVAQENHFLDASYPDIVSTIEKEVRIKKIKKVLVPLPSFNQDHRIVFEACMTALRPTWGPSPTVWAYEYPMSCWSHGQVEGQFVGRAYVSLTMEQINLKLAALAEHKTQVAGKGGLPSCNGALKLAELRGAEIGTNYAEKYVPLREII